MAIAERFRVMMQLFGITAEEVTTGAAESVKTINSSVVVTTAEVVGTETHYENANATNVWAAAQSVLIPAGANRVRIQFVQLNNTVTCRALYVVFNALNDADAAAKLALAVSRDDLIRIDQENDYQFPQTQLCTRVDWLTDQAVGASANVVRVDYTV